MKAKKLTIEKVKNILPYLNIEDAKSCLRQLREDICYKKVDRGAWFASLSTEEQEIVLEWRNNWRNVTDTFVIPETPFVVLEKR